MVKYIYTNDPKGDLAKLNKMPRCEAYFDMKVPVEDRIERLICDLCLAGLVPTMDEESVFRLQKVLAIGLNLPGEIAKWPKSTLCEGILLRLEQDGVASVREYSRLDVLFVLASAVGFGRNGSPTVRPS